MDKQTVFETIGGDAKVEKIVDILYDKVLADNLLKHFFTGKNMDFQKKHMKNFIRLATGGFDNYTGRTIKDAHKKLDIGEHHFNQIEKLSIETFREISIGELAIKNCVEVIEKQRNHVLNIEEKIESVKQKTETIKSKDSIGNFTLNPHNFEQSKISQKFVDEKLEANYYKSMLTINKKKNIFFCILNLVFFIYLIFASKWYYFNDKLFVCSIVIFIIVALIDSLLFSDHLLQFDKNFIIKIIVIFAGFTTYLLGIFTWKNNICQLELIRFVDSHVIFLLLASVFYLEFNYIIQSLLGIINIIILVGLDYSINNELTSMFLPEICYIVILYTFCILCVESKREEHSRSIFKTNLENETFFKYINSLLNGMESSIVSIKINSNNHEEDIVYSNNSYGDILKYIKPHYLKSKGQEIDASLLAVNDGNDYTSNDLTDFHMFDCKLFKIGRASCRERV